MTQEPTSTYELHIPPSTLPMDTHYITLPYTVSSEVICGQLYDESKKHGKIGSDGGPSEYYDFPEGATTLNDLIEYRNMSFAQGNIFKAAFRMGTKKGISIEYDLKKIIYYAERMLSYLEAKTTSSST